MWPPCEAVFLPNCGIGFMDRLAVGTAGWLGSSQRFGREQARESQAERLSKVTTGLFRAQATRESRHGRHPRIAFSFKRRARRRDCREHVACACGVSLSGTCLACGVRLCCRRFSGCLLLHDRATGRNGSRR